MSTIYILILNYNKKKKKKSSNGLTLIWLPNDFVASITISCDIDAHKKKKKLIYIDGLFLIGNEQLLYQFI